MIPFHHWTIPKSERVNVRDWHAWSQEYISPNTDKEVSVFDSSNRNRHTASKTIGRGFKSRRAFSPIAQRLEQRPYKPQVDGSIPSGRTMKQILLTRNQVAIVDDCDYLRLWLMGSWYCLDNDRGHKYAARSAGTRSKPAITLLHRVVAEWAYGPSTLEVDHQDGNTLNNCRGNLRYATPGQNQANGKSRGYTSDFRGVSWEHRRSKWKACIQFDGRRVFLGYFDNDIDAAFAYDKKARELFGSFARLNFERDPDHSAMCGVAAT